MWHDCKTHKNAYICLQQGKTEGQWSQISVSVKQHQCLSLSVWVTVIQASLLHCTQTIVQQHKSAHTHRYPAAACGTAALLWHTAYTAHHIRYTATPYQETCGPQRHTDATACLTKYLYTLSDILYRQVKYTWPCTMLSYCILRGAAGRWLLYQSVKAFDLDKTICAMGLYSIL